MARLDSSPAEQLEFLVETERCPRRRRRRQSGTNPQATSNRTSIFQNRRTHVHSSIRPPGLGACAAAHCRPFNDGGSVHSHDFRRVRLRRTHHHDLGTLAGHRASAMPSTRPSGDRIFHQEQRESDAFRYSNGVMTDIGRSPREPGLGIKASGQVSGFSYSTPPATSHTLHHSNGVMNDLGYGRPGDEQRRPHQRFRTGHRLWQWTRVFRYSQRHRRDLGALGGSFRRANAINASETSPALLTRRQLHPAASLPQRRHERSRQLGGQTASPSHQRSGLVAVFPLRQQHTQHAFVYSNGVMRHRTSAPQLLAARSTHREWSRYCCHGNERAFLYANAR